VALTDQATPTGLRGLGVVGIRVSTADINGDLYPDLLTRGMGLVGKREDFAVGTRQTFVLRNDLKANGTFADVTEQSGLLQTRDGQNGRQAQVLVLGDADNDGDDDAFAGLYLGSPDQDKFAGDSSELMLADGAGKFALTEASPWAQSALRGGLTAASWVDYDRDGKLDLWLGYNAFGGASLPDRLLRGNGDGTFADVTAQEGLLTKSRTLANLRAGTAHYSTWGTAACDLDNNGEAELLSVSYGRYFNAAWFPGFLEGSSRYTNLNFATHLAQDSNNDWCSNWNAQCYCADNPTAEDCEQCGAPEVNCKQLKAAFGGTYRWNHSTDREAWRLGGNTGTIVCADLDADGDLDLVESTIVHPDVGPSSDPSRIVRNDGGSPPDFVHLLVSDSGVGHSGEDDTGDITAAVLDFDNDGRLDILLVGSEYPGTRAKLYHQLPDGKFADVTEAVGLDHPHASGAAVADFDRDGDLDIAMGHSRSRCSSSPKECWPTEEVHFWRNDVGNQRNWLQLKLIGTGGSNRSAIGARVTVQTAQRTQTFEVSGGHGHFGVQHDLVVHAGLGDACEATVTVRWPDAAGSTQTWRLGAGRLHVLTQGEAEPGYPVGWPE